VIQLFCFFICAVFALLKQNSMGKMMDSENLKTGYHKFGGNGGRCIQNESEIEDELNFLSTSVIDKESVQTFSTP